ncbi:MAG: secondary thiamine-phosphate synthase enzyme YjbQ [Desulfobacterota bacterium]|nr:secondary thiamine-phosphate synthase enzyme YjbQ [Thermodesulfobacteriota bacterium]
MSIKKLKILVSTSPSVDIRDITNDVVKCIRQSGLADGLVHLFIPGSTAALTTIEYEPGVVNDLRKAFERIVPDTIAYDHDRAWGDGNGHAHVRAALLGPSLTVPVENGRLQLGTWQQIVLCDFDTRPRQRTVLVHIMPTG